MRFLAVLLALAVTATMSLPASAQHGRKSSQYEREREARSACREPVRAAGDAYYVIRSARRSAIKRWQEQVINAHGERFITWENAKVVEYHCDPARVGGGQQVWNLKRCVIVARPCRNDGF
ncbi:hypothetical protein JDN41_12655 [Rhodomicrobium udaipurense]|uniref:Uncharacterized protein n=2 Tax=Rhodomicrobium udaipurense TaxID=1202716 RepID=A0A8I1GC75_9HYPH|nr:hypothetical protein [Rhodomicrobium udaipurense]MBJ7544398.1 hypothetical protein [Rhodomicrobium udaipurense]